MRIQIREYANFIKSFTENVEIMTKNFFIIVPYVPLKLDFSKKGGGLGASKKPTDKAEVFEESRIQLDQRTSVVSSGLSACGIRTVPLGTEEVVEVFYKLFNPGDMDKPIVIQQ